MEVFLCDDRLVITIFIALYLQPYHQDINEFLCNYASK